MKRITLTFIAVSICIALAGQKMQIGVKSMSQGPQPAYSLTIADLSDKEVEDLWMDYLKEFKTKPNPNYDRKLKEYFADDLSIPSISANTIDVYSVLEGGKTATELTVWFDLGGAFLSQQDHGEKISAVSEWMDGFVQTTLVRKVELELDAEEAVLKDLDKEYDRLMKEQEKLEKLIKDCEEQIAKAKSELKDNASAQAEKMKLLEDQKRVVEEVKARLKRM